MPDKQNGISGTAEVGHDDVVYPLHSFDLFKMAGGFMIRTMLFNDQLNPIILKNSLSKLVNTGDWRKFGGRVRISVS